MAASFSSSLSQLVNICKIHSLLDLRGYLKTLQSLNDLNFNFGFDNHRNNNGNGRNFRFDIADVYLRFLANTRIPWDGCLPLVYCVENGYELLAIELVRGINGIDVNCYDGNGKTALHAAVLSGRYSMCQLLVEEGANIECEMLGQSMLQSIRNRLWTSTQNIPHNTRAVDLNQDMFSALAPSNFSFASDTPLVLACRLGHAHIAQLLLENGADPTGRKNRSNRSFSGDTYRTPLMEAVRHGRLDIVAMLLSTETMEQEDHNAALEYAINYADAATITVLEKYNFGNASRNATVTGSGNFLTSSMISKAPTGGDDAIRVQIQVDINESKEKLRSSFTTLSEAALPRILRKRVGSTGSHIQASRALAVNNTQAGQNIQTSSSGLSDMLLHGDVNAVESYLETHGAVVERHHLFEACMFNNSEALELLLTYYCPEQKNEKKIDVGSDTSIICNLILIALSKGYTNMLRFLVKIFSEISDIDRCITHGAKLGRTSEVEIILNAYPGAVNSGVLETALEAAACRGHANVIGVIFTYEIDFLESQELRSFYCRRALINAQKAGFEQCVIEILVAKPSLYSDVNEIKIGEFPLFVHAAKFGLCKILRTYASNEQVNVNIKCPDTDRTALMWTSDYEVLRILVSNERVDVNSTDSEGTTLFKLITKPKPVLGQPINLYSLFDGKPVSKRKQCLELLLTREDVDINKEFTYPNNYLMVLTCPQWHLCNDKELLQVILLDERTNINAQDGEGRTFLSKCCHWSRWDDFNLALSIGRTDLDVNIPDNTGWNPLLICVRYSRVSEIFKLLRNPDINTNYSMDDGWNALLLAAAYGHLDVIKLLVNIQSNICLGVYFNGMPPWRVAEINGHASTAAYLQKLGKVPGRRVMPYEISEEEQSHMMDLVRKPLPHPRKRK